jgi:hypothetical protein
VLSATSLPVVAEAGEPLVVSLRLPAIQRSAMEEGRDWVALLRLDEPNSHAHDDFQHYSVGALDIRTLTNEGACVVWGCGMAASGRGGVAAHEYTRVCLWCVCVSVLVCVYQQEEREEICFEPQMDGFEGGGASHMYEVRYVSGDRVVARFGPITVLSPYAAEDGAAEEGGREVEEATAALAGVKLA